ncbi:hypothetical protein G6F68_016631 [Rhizopus microsporus]|nr:hypothetical protein G6F68_016631 [Rhizopus microsporus]
MGNPKREGPACWRDATVAGLNKRRNPARACWMPALVGTIIPASTHGVDLQWRPHRARDRHGFLQPDACLPPHRRTRRAGPCRRRPGHVASRAEQAAAHAGDPPGRGAAAPQCARRRPHHRRHAPACARTRDPGPYRCGPRRCA